MESNGEDLVDVGELFTDGEWEETRQDALHEIAGMTPAQLRKIRGLTQEDLAELLKITQATLSRRERREDMLVSTLREMVEALGGTLELVARFETSEKTARLPIKLSA